MRNRDWARKSVENTLLAAPHGPRQTRRPCPRAANVESLFTSQIIDTDFNIAG